MRTGSPPAMAGQACAWAAVGPSNARSNHSRTAGVKAARGDVDTSVRGYPAAGERRFGLPPSVGCPRAGGPGGQRYGDGEDRERRPDAPAGWTRRLATAPGCLAHASARTRPAAIRSAAVSPWTLNALASFPPFVSTISASAVGVIAAATSAQPNVTRPAEAKTASNTTPEVMSRAPLISVRARRLSAATPKSSVAWRGRSTKRRPRTMIPAQAMSPTSRAARCMGEVPSYALLALLYNNATV